MRKFYGLVFLGYFSRISDGHPYPFYPKYPPGGGATSPLVLHVYKLVLNRFYLFLSDLPPPSPLEFIVDNFSRMSGATWQVHSTTRIT